MHRSLAPIGVLLLAAPGCAARSADSAPPPILPEPHKDRVVQAGAMCAHMQDLHEKKCGMFTEIELGGTCEQEVTGSLQDPRRRILTEQMDVCTTELTTCSDITACIGASEAGELRGCSDHSEREVANAVGVPYVAWRAEMKRGITKFSEVQSSKEAPIGLCGVSTENYWFTTLACDDGSLPLATKSAAERARLGNVGAGGRCGSIIDHYRVRCPERAYELYIDDFVCPLPE